MPEYSEEAPNKKMQVNQFYSVKKFGDYLSALMKAQDRYLITYGWLESELAHHHEALRRYSVKLRNSD